MRLFAGETTISAQLRLRPRTPSGVAHRYVPHVRHTAAPGGRRLAVSVANTQVHPGACVSLFVCALAV